jgi:hypothetical protein
MRDHEHETDPEAPVIARNLQTIYDSIPEDERWSMTIRGVNHFTFSDHLFGTESKRHMDSSEKWCTGLDRQWPRNGDHA